VREAPRLRQSGTSCGASRERDIVRGCISSAAATGDLHPGCSKRAPLSGVAPHSLVTVELLVLIGAGPSSRRELSAASPTATASRCHVPRWNAPLPGSVFCASSCADGASPRKANDWRACADLLALPLGAEARDLDHVVEARGLKTFTTSRLLAPVESATIAEGCLTTTTRVRFTEPRRTRRRAGSGCSPHGQPRVR